MAKELKSLLESSVLTDDVKEEIKEAWEAKVQEVREEVIAEVRDEFASRFEKDKSEIVEGLDAKLNDVLKEHIVGLDKEKKAAIEEQVKYKMNSKKHAKEFMSLAESVLKKEIAEFRDERKAVSAQLENVFEMMKTQLEKVLKEYREETSNLAADRVNFKVNSRKELAETKKKLSVASAKAAKVFVETTLSNELSQLKDELKEARENNLGRKIFEAFSSEFSATFFNENAQLNKLAKAIEERERKLEEAKQEKEKIVSQLEESRKQNHLTETRLKREKTLNKLLAPLGGEKREVMEELLEKTPTHLLTEHFNKYLPTLLEDGSGNSRKHKMINESSNNLRDVTGDRENVASEPKTETKAAIGSFVSSFQKLNNA